MQSILEESLTSVIHQLVSEQHSKEKQLLQTLHPQTLLPLCQSCGLPRLLDPPLAISRPDRSTQYCSLVPWSRRAGHDIYGNPFPVAGSDKPATKKEREARLKAENSTKHGKSKDNSQEPNGTPSSPTDQPNVAGGPIDKKAAKVGEKLKGGTYIPWHTCPNCKRSLLITRFAQHLEKCLGIGGRARNAARNAGSASQGTPSASRGGTPIPGSKDRGSVKGDPDDDDDDDEDVKKGNVRKTVLKRKLKQGSKSDRPGKLTAPTGTKAGKLSRSSENGEKRDRDEEDEDATPLRKKQKIQRAPSTVSLGNMSVDNDASILGDESVDGSFVAADEEESEGDV